MVTIFWTLLKKRKTKMDSTAVKQSNTILLSHVCLEYLKNDTALSYV